MPTVLRAQGFKLSFYAGDHDPPHVHVRYGGAEIIVDLGTGQTRDNRGMKPPDIVRAVRIVEQHQDMLLAAWATFDQMRGTRHGLAPD